MKKQPADIKTPARPPSANQPKREPYNPNFPYTSDEHYRDWTEEDESAQFHVPSFILSLIWIAIGAVIIGIVSGGIRF